MKVTKYDIADVLLVCLCVSYIPMVFVMFFMQIGIVMQDMTDLNFADGRFLIMVSFQSGYLFVVCAIMYFLILKRKPIINFFFRESESKELTIPDGLTILIQYSFWIRLSGILMMLREGTNLIQWISAEFMKSQMDERQMNFLSLTLQAFVGIIVGLLVIWKADWIAEQVKRITPCKPAETIEVNSISQ